MENDQKLIRPGEAHNELAHDIWANSDQYFVGKWAETGPPIRGQNTAETHWCTTKS